MNREAPAKHKGIRQRSSGLWAIDTTFRSRRIGGSAPTLNQARLELANQKLRILGEDLHEAKTGERNGDSLWTTEKVANYLQVSRAFVLKLVNEGTLPAIDFFQEMKNGKRRSRQQHQDCRSLRFYHTDVRSWASRCSGSPPPNVWDRMEVFDTLFKEFDEYLESKKEEE